MYEPQPRPANHATNPSINADASRRQFESLTTRPLTSAIDPKSSHRTKHEMEFPRFRGHLIINDEPAGLEDPPDRRFRRQAHEASEILGDRCRPGIQPGLGEPFTFIDDRIFDTHRRLVRHRVGRPRLRLPARSSPAR